MRTTRTRTSVSLNIDEAITFRSLLRVEVKTLKEIIDVDTDDPEYWQRRIDEADAIITKLSRFIDGK